MRFHCDSVYTITVRSTSKLVATCEKLLKSHQSRGSVQESKVTHKKGGDM